MKIKKFGIFWFKGHGLGDSKNNVHVKIFLQWLLRQFVLTRCL